MKCFERLVLVEEVVELAFDAEYQMVVAVEIKPVDVGYPAEVAPGRL
jgi:hypothetical protein